MTRSENNETLPNLSETENVGSCRQSWRIWLLLVYVAALCGALALLWARPASFEFREPEVNSVPVSLRPALGEAAGLAATGLYQGVVLVLSGLIAFGSVRVVPGRIGRSVVVLVVLLLSLSGLIVYRCGLEDVGWLLGPAAALAVWGWLLGAALARGFRGAAVWGVSSGVSVAALLSAGLFLVTDPAPAVAGPVVVTEHDRQHLRELLRTADAGHTGNFAVPLSPSDLNLIAASWIDAQHCPLWPEFELPGAVVRGRITTSCRVPGLGVRYLNFVVEGRPKVAAGRLAPEMSHLTVGRVTLPHRLVKYVSTTAGEVINTDPHAQRTLQAIEALEISGGVLTVSGSHSGSPSALLAQAGGLADRHALAQRVSEHLESLVKSGCDLPAGDARFTGLLQCAFRRASERTAEGADPAAENTAALVALGIALGDARLRHLAGFEREQEYARFKTKFTDETTLRGRNDLCRHFVVSAALTVLAGESASAAAGLLKEQLDAAGGGSGFSFADLAADFAGTRFAQRATGTDARLLQAHVSQPLGVADLLPPLDGLVEGLSDAEFRERYGSVEDPRFRAVTADIKGRLETCSLLQSP